MAAKIEAKIIEKFTPELVKALCDCIRSVADSCMASGLIHGDTCDEILESMVTSEDKTRKLLKAVKNCIEIDSVSFEIFLRILNEKLPERIKAKLLRHIRAELASEQAQATPANECKALVSSDHEAMASVHHGQLSLLHIHKSDLSRVLCQEQNPFVGKLEESIREHERTIAEKKLLKEKLEENEKLKAQLLLLSNTNENQSTVTSISEADMLQLKEKIEKLEQKSKDLSVDIRRHRCAIDVMGEKITQKLMIEQKKLEIQYERRFQELKKSMMNHREFERESHRYGSYYESDPEDGSVMNYRESKRERSSYYGSPDSREGSDYDVPISKQAQSDNGTKADDADDAVNCSLPDISFDRPTLKAIATELNKYIAKSGLESRWEELGIQLDVEYDRLTYFRRAHRETSEYLCDHDDRGFRDVIAEWLKQKNPPPTWSKLMEALEILNFSDFAAQLRSKYCPSSGSQIQEDPQNGDGL